MTAEAVFADEPKLLRAAVIGCGAIAGNHVAAYRDVPGVEIVACFDTDNRRVRAFAADHDIAFAASSLDELFDHGVDLISVCTPHPTHEAVVVAAAKRGVHVLCEKPIAIDVAAAERMVSACSDAGVVFGCVFQRRLWPAAQRIRRAIDDGTIGDPMMARAEVLLHRDSSYYTGTPWRGKWETDGGGVLMTQAIHYVDLLQWYLGDVDWVMTTADTFKHGEYIEVEDTLAATLKFTSGAIAQFTASTALTPALGQRIAITGSTGATVGLLEYPEGTEAVNDVWAVSEQQTFDGPREVLADVSLDRINASLAPFHAAQIVDFVAAVRSGATPLVSGQDALRSLRTMSAMYQSMRSGQPESPETTDRPVGSESIGVPESHSHPQTQNSLAGQDDVA
ncbi:Gfo/Idh/MocA family protein [Brevibacterium zhoupengii]|uniref:Gfo/Idh/MocA family protein n=1 Tax=Brevibacterium zhoupengii TaxID=2898795 RepID=UPI001E4321C1|nr:Gfo/Idh/MocA family oxidoreductase [Brevibacterium zhoupengii]